MKPIHLDAQPADFEGNDGKGRFLLLPGSRDRAEKIASLFHNVRVNRHPRGHDLHLGCFTHAGKQMDVGVVSTGMGCPSLDLIVSELIALGAKVLLRVGTSGSLQPHVKTGDVVVATAAVRDEATSDHYLPREFPALAAWSLVLAIQRASEKLSLRGTVHFGPVHTKDSLYARELGWGPLAAEHKRYSALLTSAGVLASEMECAHLFVLGQLGAEAVGMPVLSGGVVAVIGDHDTAFRHVPEAQMAVDDAIALALASLGELI